MSAICWILERQSSWNFHKRRFPTSQLGWLLVGSCIKPKLINLKFKPHSLFHCLFSSQTSYLEIPDRSRGGVSPLSAPFEDRIEEWLEVWGPNSNRPECLSKLHHALAVVATQPPGSPLWFPWSTALHLSMFTCSKCHPPPTPTDIATSTVLWFLFHFHLFACVCLVSQSRLCVPSRLLADDQKRWTSTMSCGQSWLSSPLRQRDAQCIYICLWDRCLKDRPLLSLFSPIIQNNHEQKMGISLNT